MTQPAVLDRFDRVVKLDRHDRNLLLIVLGVFVVLLVALAVFGPNRDADRDPTPSSYLAGKHGAKAAFRMLQQSGYTVERWESPLSALAAHADSSTVLVIAEPFSAPKDDQAAIREILSKGGRVLATGIYGGALLPEGAVTMSKSVSFADCEAHPEGMEPLAREGSIWINPRLTWRLRDPGVHAIYTCADEPVVVEYASGKGHVIWWAASTPLENGSIQRGQNLELLLRSIDPGSFANAGKGLHIYWDESMHRARPTAWDYTRGPIWPMLWSGALGLALLIVFSYSRRSGPVRPLPLMARTTPIEFLDALGSLYRSTGATSTAMQIAWERFRAQAGLLTGQRTSQMHAEQLAAAIEQRFGAVDSTMKPDLLAAEEACWEDALKPRRALILIRALRAHEEAMRATATRPSAAGKAPVT